MYSSTFKTLALVNENIGFGQGSRNLILPVSPVIFRHINRVYRVIFGPVFGACGVEISVFFVSI